MGDTWPWSPESYLGPVGTSEFKWMMVCYYQDLYAFRRYGYFFVDGAPHYVLLCLN